MPVDYTPLKRALAEIKSDFDMADEDFAGEKIKSWIEQSQERMSLELSELK